MLKYAKTQHLQESIIRSKGDTKKLYQVVNKAIGKRNENPLPDSINSETLANDFANFFLNKIITIRTKFEDKPMPFIENKDIPALRKFAPLTVSDVRKTISSMKSTSCELDKIPTSFLKTIIDTVIDDITKLVNMSLGHGIFCKHWKLAIIKPLLKKIRLELILKNYRPVSNLSFLSKLVEKCALDQFLLHCKQFNLLPDYQSAYRVGYSCETCILKLTNHILNNMEKQRITSSIFLDLSAAFDTVDHSILLDILNKHFGIADTALQWYQSYLSNRSFKVAVDNHYSEEKTFNFSVPQGVPLVQTYFRYTVHLSIMFLKKAFKYRVLLTTMLIITVSTQMRERMRIKLSQN